MRFLLDTNISLHLANENDAEHELVNEALETTVTKGDTRSQRIGMRWKSTGRMGIEVY